MNKWACLVLLLIIGLIIGLAIVIPDAKSVVKKHLEAIESQKLAQIKTLRTTKTDLFTGISVDITELYQRPSNYCREVETYGIHMATMRTNGEYYKLVSNEPLQKISQHHVGVLMLDNDLLTDPLQQAMNSKWQMDYLAVDTIGSVKTDVISVITSSNDTCLYWIAQTNRFILQSLHQYNVSPSPYAMRQRFSDFRQVGGIIFPFKIITNQRIIMDDGSIVELQDNVSTIHEVVLNPPLVEALFEVPK